MHVRHVVILEGWRSKMWEWAQKRWQIADLAEEEEKPRHDEEEGHNKSQACAAKEQLDRDTESAFFGAGVRLQIHGLFIE